MSKKDYIIIAKMVGEIVASLSDSNKRLGEVTEIVHKNLQATNLNYNRDAMGLAILNEYAKYHSM